MPTLWIIDGPVTNTGFALEEHNLVMLGRDSKCTFQIRDDHISRRHAKIKMLEKGGHGLIDNGSVNGVLLNGHPIQPQEVHPLADGDEVRLGRTTLVYTHKNYAEAQRAMEGLRAAGEHRRGTLEMTD